MTRWLAVLALVVAAAGCYQTSSTKIEDYPEPDATAFDAVNIPPDAWTLEKCMVDSDCAGKVQVGACELAACEGGVCVASSKAAGATCYEAALSPGQCEVTVCQAQTSGELACVVQGAPAGYPCGTFYAACGAAGKCTVDGECTDPCVSDNICLTGSCTAEGCDWAAANEGLACDDGNICTDNEVCVNGECSGVQVCDCVNDDDCKDIDDEDLCNGILVCKNNKCQTKQGSVVACEQTGKEPCTVNECQPATGECLEVVAADNTVCSDSFDCTQGDFCVSGECKGNAAVVCEYKCSDNEDDDDDTLIDCDDDDCFDFMGCKLLSCGDDQCLAPETCANCEEDCGPCGPVCGDDNCEPPTETCDTCEEDCGPCGPVCGDDECKAPEEDCTSCPEDCGECPKIELCYNEIDDDDDTLVDCDDDGCAESVFCVANDTCAVARPVALNPVGAGHDGMVVLLSDTTVGLAMDYSGSCDVDTAQASDAVWTFTLAEQMVVTVTLTFTDTALLYPAAYIRAADCEAGTEVACMSITNNGPLVMTEKLDAGTYYLFVDAGWKDDASAYDMAVGFSVVTDTETVCDDGIDNDLDDEMDCCDSDCVGATACLAETVCGDLEDNDCDSFVDCQDTDCASDTNCLGEDCGSALSIGDGVAFTASDIGEQVVVTGDTTFKVNDFVGTCSSASGLAKDAVYSFKLGERMMVKATLAMDDTYLWPVLYVLPATCLESGEIACEWSHDGGVVSLVRALDAGEYFLVVDTDYEFDDGPYSLTFEVMEEVLVETNCTDASDDDGDGDADCLDADCATDAACLGENCESPIPVAENAISASQAGTPIIITGTTENRLNDYGGTCSTESHVAVDAVYVFSVETAMEVKISHDFNTDWLYPALYVYKGTCTELNEIACQANYSDDAVVVIFTALPGNNYYIVADADYDTDDGEFTLALEFSPPPSNETNCSDGVDEDFDELTDCCDDDCTGDASCVELLCSDGLDNDCDGDKDCLDSDCDGLFPCPPYTLYSENFNAAGLPAGWTVEGTLAGDCAWAHTTSGFNGTGAAEAGDLSGCLSGETKLLSKPITAAGCKQIGVSWMEKGVGLSGFSAHTLEISQGTSGSGTRNLSAPLDTWSLSAEQVSTVDPYGPDFRLGWIFTGADIWYIDSVEVVCLSVQ